jgi:hypothetical protein
MRPSSHANLDGRFTIVANEDAFLLHNLLHARAYQPKVGRRTTDAVPACLYNYVMKRSSKAFATILILACAVSLVFSQPAPQRTPRGRFGAVPGGFATGGMFLKWDQDGQTAYGVGFYNGLSVSSVVTDATYEKVQWLDACAKGMEAEQIGAILKKYIQDHPAEWQDPLNLLSLDALREGCKR